MSRSSSIFRSVYGLFHEPQIFLVHLSEVLMLLQMITDQKKCTEASKCTKNLKARRAHGKRLFHDKAPLSPFVVFQKAAHVHCVLIHILRSFA